VVPLAHLLAPSSAPAALGWTVSLGLATGLCLLFLARAGWRWAGAALCLLAGAAGLSMVVVASGTAGPDQRLLLVAPDASVELTSPVEIHVCALTLAGSSAPLPGTGRMLAVLVDGIPVGTRASPVFALELPPGRHRPGGSRPRAAGRSGSLSPLKPQR
jgi:hypothetical protein